MLHLAVFCLLTSQVALCYEQFMTSAGLAPRGGFDRGLEPSEIDADGYEDYMYPPEDQSTNPDYQDPTRRLQVSTNCPFPENNAACPKDYDWQCGAPWRFCGTSCLVGRKWDCLCDQDIDGDRFCWQNDYCLNLLTCSSNYDCLTQVGSNYRCVPDTCCGVPKCIKACEEPDCPADPYPDNECPCEGPFWSCVHPGGPFQLNRCGDVPNSWFGCYCVPQIQSNPRNWVPQLGASSCVENNWCSAAPNCNTDADCDLIAPGYECIPNTCCRNRKKCVRCCRDPY
jgi:hypothetical protein